MYLYCNKNNNCLLLIDYLIYLIIVWTACKYVDTVLYSNLLYLASYPLIRYTNLLYGPSSILF